MKANTKLTKMLPAETAKQFQVIGLKNYSKKSIFGRFGIIDFSVMSVKHAKVLINMGFPYLVPKKKSTAKDSE